MSRPKLSQIFCITLATLCLIAISPQANAAKKAQSEKEAVILLPLVISAEAQNMSSEMQAAVVQGLQQKYLVYSGDRVLQELKKAANKENHAAKHDCDETRCLQDISVAFQTENVAVVHINKIEGGYLLSLSIKAVISNEAVYDNSLPCKGCDAFAVVEKLKDLVGVPEGTTKTVPKDTSSVAASASGNNASLNINCTGDDIGAEVWINDKLRGECPVELKVPSGTIKLKVIKAVDDDHERVQEQAVKVFEDSVKRVDAKLSLQLNAVAQALEAEAEKAKAQRIAMLPMLTKKIDENMVPIPNKNYALGKYEVTQKEWRDIMDSNPSSFSFKRCGDSCPVEQVSWNDAQEFLKKLNANTGKHYRLPTVDEWKYACYGGAKTGIFRSPDYCGGNDLGNVGWYKENSNKTTHPVGQKQANGYGLYDMSGNVWEWTDEGSVRGGSWDNDSDVLRADFRSVCCVLDYQNNSVGFRLARTLP